MAIFDGFPDTSVGTALCNCLKIALDDYDYGAEAVMNSYAELCTSIYEEGGDLGFFVREHIRSGDNLYMEKYLEGSVTEEMDDAAFEDLLAEIRLRVPVVEVADDTHSLCMGCPYSKVISVFSLIVFRMSAKLFVDLVMCALSEPVAVGFRNKAKSLIDDCHKKPPSCIFLPLWLLFIIITSPQTF